MYKIDEKEFDNLRYFFWVDYANYEGFYSYYISILIIMEIIYYEYMYIKN